MSSLFEGKPKELEYVFDKILAEIIEWDDVIVNNTRKAILFVHNQTFLVIRPMTKVLDLQFYSQEAQSCPPFFKSRSVSKKYENHLRISTLEELSPELISWIRDSYLML
ncbi:DUF5655 domain-containing protein [Algoriphagus sediminis]|uniref:DUF5655 domain-containing protein n=1 Tax=Algoriphagus sediminis TaxID=3057113 RepID=A0ABT7YCG2_9BACT|nr:DUF5655 domain-containing protein [Algoriphagus sediminis]MDN3204177.1 DUF5655 domain-containing protein [Algoriphagus sediminis]